jgi:hypothetical protein
MKLCLNLAAIAYHATRFLSCMVGGIRRSPVARAARIGMVLFSVCFCFRPDTGMAQAMQIFTRNLTPIAPRTFTLDVDESDSIENVKQKIQDKVGFAPSDQSLFFAGTFLSEGRTLADYNIGNESIINMAVIDSFDDLAFSTGLPVGSGFNPFMMRSATSGAGAGWSVFNYTNAVDLSASGVGAYTLSLYTIAPGIGGSVPGGLPGFDALQSYDWTFVTSAAGITGFSPDQFVIDAGDFADPYPGVFAVAQQGDSLAITYSPVPESSTLTLVAVAAVGCSAHLLRRRKRAKVA